MARECSATCAGRFPAGQNAPALSVDTSTILCLLAVGVALTGITFGERFRSVYCGASEKRTCGMWSSDWEFGQWQFQLESTRFHGQSV